jgi:hypothetical protein
MICLGRCVPRASRFITFVEFISVSQEKTVKILRLWTHYE